MVRRAIAPFDKWGTQTFIAGLTTEGMIAPFVLSRAMEWHVFNHYVETQRGTVATVGGALSFSTISRARKSKIGCQNPQAAQVLVCVLPPYPTDLNPIKRRSPNSRNIFAGSVHEPAINSHRQSAKFALCTNPKNAGTFSRLLDMPSR